MLKGKKLSILGDSISTYEGVSDDGCANSALIYNPYHYYSGKMPLEKTYWMRVMQELGLTLCVNNSWSGGNLSGRDDESAGINRARHLSRDDGETPDIIIVFIGTNDLGRVSLISPETFAEDYHRTLEIINEEYPDAYVCCVNLADKGIPSLNSRRDVFNGIIENAAASMGERFFIADQHGSSISGEDYYWYTLDGIHPNEVGMEIIANVIRDAIKNKFGIL